jgi:HPt (histidine-containing phosphotransfer) domain-containing protein
MDGTANGDFDPEALRRLRDLGGEALVAGTLANFADWVAARVAEAEAAARTGDASAVARATHSLRTSAANIGARRLLAAAVALDGAAAAAPSAALPALAGELRAAYDAARDYFRTQDGRRP